MKKIFYAILLLPLALASCEDWLDVKPKSEIKLDEMFSTEQGFKDALVGCYIKLSEPSLYGAELTCTFMDVLAQQYEHLGSTSSDYDKASQYIYTDATCERIIDGIWSNLYNVVANVNAIMEGLETAKDKIHPTIYALTKAETYALRAFIYTDLVRIFTWGNLPQRPEMLERASIPYVRKYDKHISRTGKLGEVLEAIHADIETALELFRAYDPDSEEGERPEGYTLPNDDRFYDSDVRRFRMNYRAALALRMRVNMWEGRYGDAYADAVKLAGFEHGWASRLDGDENERDLTFSAEMIFGVETHERFERTVKRYFKLTAADDLNMNYAALYLPKDRVEDLYEVGAGFGASDWRYMRQWDKSEYNNTFLKYWEYEDMVFSDMMPLIKWPEVYYTLAECELRAGGEENRRKAVDNLNIVRKHRNLPVSVNLSHALTTEQVWDELYKEWCKEYIGDGQLFYYYKRNGYTSIPHGPANTYGDNVYVLPMPQDEIDFGGRKGLTDYDTND